MGLNYRANKVTGTRLASRQGNLKTAIVSGKIKYCLIMNSSTTATVTVTVTETLTQPTMTDAQCAHLSKVLPQDGDLFTPYVVNCVIMSVLSGTAVLGNVLILVSLCRAPQFLRQPSYFLLLNLAFADLCVGFVAEPLYLMYKISYLLNPFSILSCYAGVVFNFFSYLLTSLSLWTAAAISLDRLLALLLHMKYCVIVTKRRIIVLIAVLLVLSFAFASMFQWALDAQNTVFVCVNSLALLIALLSYVRIFQIVRYHQRQISSHQLGEISFTDRGETVSVGTSFHGREMREQLKEVAIGASEDEGTVGDKKATGAKALREIEQHRSYHQQLQKATSASSLREGLEYQQLDVQTEIARSKNLRKSNAQPQGLENVAIKENTSQLVDLHFDSSGVTKPAQIDISVLGNLYHGTEPKRVASEIAEGSEESPAEEGSRNFLTEKGSSGSRQGNRASNSELVMTEMQALKVSHEDQNNSVKSNILQEESCTLREKQTETRSLENENQNNAIVKEKTPALSGETQEIKDTTTVPAFTLDLHGSSANNEIKNADLTTNKTRKGFKMRHFKKSFYNMFVIWFLMLLCYLPGICTSMLFLLMGRSHAMHLAFNFTTSVMFLNSSINPIVFCWRIREFRTAVKKTLKEVFGIWSNNNIGGS